mgnify:CR=1 FL=1
MLIKRILTALVLAPAAILAIFYLPLDLFAILLVGLIGIGAWEWGPLMGFNSVGKRSLFVLSNIVILALIWQLLPPEALWSSQSVLSINVEYILWLSVGWWCLSAFLTYVYPRCSSFWSSHRSVRGVFGWLTLLPTWVAFLVLRSNGYQEGDTYHGAQLIMFLFMLVWSADIGAYFVGKSLGKHKLLPNVSPGKTLEGFIGGILCACIMVLILGFTQAWKTEQYVTVIGITLLITTISVLGDLNESMFKRQAGVKDSGSILPGHGGILDRIDSLTATAPIFALCYLYLGW